MKLSFNTTEYKWITIPSHDTLLFHDEKSFVTCYSSHGSHRVNYHSSTDSLEAKREIEYYRCVVGSIEHETIF